MQTLTFSIPAINCGHCVNTIKNELSELEGISSVEGDVVTKKISVVIGEPATEASIRSLLAEINYPAE